jgi:hypothetical protein
VTQVGQYRPSLLDGRLLVPVEAALLDDRRLAQVDVAFLLARLVIRWPAF